MITFFLIFLIIAFCYHSATTQDNGHLSLDIINNSSFIQELVYYGSQVVVGQAGDSGLLSESYLSSRYPQNYSVSIKEKETINITVDAFIHIKDRERIHSIYVVNFDPSTNTRKVLSYSYEWPDNSYLLINGLNVSYEADQDSYKIIPFNDYSIIDIPKSTKRYSSGQDFREHFSNWTSLNASAIYDNQTLQYAFNAVLRGLRSWNWPGNLMSPNYEDLNVTKMHSIDTFAVQEVADVFRYDFDFKTANHSGRVVCVAYCPLTMMDFIPPWPSFFPKLPLTVSNGLILSNLDSEGIGENYDYLNYEEGYSAEEYYASEGIEDPHITYWYHFNCFFADMRYYWFVEFTRSS